MGKRGQRRSRRISEDSSDAETRQTVEIEKCAQVIRHDVESGSIVVETQKDDVGMRVDAILALRLPDGPTRSRVQRAIKDGGVLLNGTPLQKLSTKLRVGDCLTWVRDAVRQAPKDVEPEPIPLSILHEDDDIIVVCKPAGMAVHPAGGLRSGTLVNALLYHTPFLSQLSSVEADASDGDCTDDEVLDPDIAFENARGSDRKAQVATEGVSEDTTIKKTDNPSPYIEQLVRPGIVHRLDRGTSGVMVVAKTNKAHVKLATQFAAHTSQRSYVALVSGVPKPSTGTVESWIGRDPGDRLRMAVVKDGKGKLAITHYSVLEDLDSGNASLVQFRLETGRTHQIRVHARHIGHPLLGDTVYNGAQLLCGPRTELRMKAYADLFDKVLERPALHAETLCFTHPCSSEWMSFRASLPCDMQETISCLKKLHSSR